jgi:hypothetical protein
VLQAKQNSKSVDLLDFGHSADEMQKVPEMEEEPGFKTKKSFVRFNNSGVVWNQLEQNKRPQPSRSFLKT